MRCAGAHISRLSIENKSNFLPLYTSHGSCSRVTTLVGSYKSLQIEAANFGKFRGAIDYCEAFHQIYQTSSLRFLTSSCSHTILVSALSTESALYICPEPQKSFFNVVFFGVCPVLACCRQCPSMWLFWQLLVQFETILLIYHLEWVFLVSLMLYITPIFRFQRS